MSLDLHVIIVCFMSQKSAWSFDRVDRELWSITPRGRESRLGQRGGEKIMSDPKKNGSHELIAVT